MKLIIQVNSILLCMIMSIMIFSNLLFACEDFHQIGKCKGIQMKRAD